MQKKLLNGGVVLASVVLSLSACGSNSDSKSTTTTAAPATTTTAVNFSVVTPDGQVSISLNGQLPPNWPAEFPTPSGMTPAGSGSLGGKESTALVGVYTSSASPQDTFNSLKANPAFTTNSVTAIGSGDKYVASFKMTAPVTGRVTVVPHGSGSMAIVAIDAAGTTNSTVASTTTVVSSSTTY